MASTIAAFIDLSDWEPAEVIALVGVILAPVASIIGVFVAQAWEGKRAVRRIHAEQRARRENRAFDALDKERAALHDLQAGSQRLWSSTQNAFAEILDAERGPMYMAFAAEMTAWHHLVFRVAHTEIRELGMTVDDRITSINENFIDAPWGEGAPDPAAFAQATKPQLGTLSKDLTALDRRVGERLAEIFELETAEIA